MSRPGVLAQPMGLSTGTSVDVVLMLSLTTRACQLALYFVYFRPIVAFIVLVFKMRPGLQVLLPLLSLLVLVRMSCVPMHMLYLPNASAGQQASD